MGRTGEFLFVELKVVKQGLKVDLSPHQVAFHLKHAGDLRCPTFIIVHYDPQAERRRGDAALLVYRGDQVMDVHQLGVRAEPLARWPWRGVQWEILRQVLLTGESV